jgi:formylglycine-generating enzyme required for sulfatase activity
LQQLIGTGQFGEVFRALAPGGVEVAIKRIFRSVDDDSARRERQSLELIKSLRHPFLLQTQAYWAQEDRLYIVMELAEDCLADWYRQCRRQGLPGIPAEELLAYFAEAAEALDYLHSQQVVHRDVKPANLLRLRGHAKVADFGLARLQEGRLVTATFCGTPLYMAPEMWHSRVSIQSDQYSLAVTYAEMRLGRRPYSGKDQFEVGRQHLVADPDLAGLNEAEQGVLRQALAKDPEQRHPSCRDFIRALVRAQAPPPPPVIVTRPRRARWPVLLGLVLLAGLVALLPLAWRLAGQVASQAPAAPLLPLEVWLPEGFVPADDAQILQGYYDRIERRLEGARPVELLLIRRKRPEDPPLFYIMRDKVSNEQFAAALRDQRMLALLEEFAGGRPWTVRRKWEQAVKDSAAGRLPLFDVTVTEAHCFAAWLGGPLGKLPSCRQWDKAAGRFDGDEGPFRSSWKKGEIALKLKRPRPVGRSPGDVSRFHCHDMAGNGRELTRDLADPPDATVPYAGAHPGQATPVLLRGHSFDDDQPFTFAQLEVGSGGTQDYDGARYDVGFRVVIELPVEP